MPKRITVMWRVRQGQRYLAYDRPTGQFYYDHSETRAYRYRQKVHADLSAALRQGDRVELFEVR